MPASPPALGVDRAALRLEPCTAAGLLAGGHAAGNPGLGRSNLGDCLCALAAEWDHFRAEQTDRFEGKFWVHARVIETEPHERHVEFVPVFDHAFRNLQR